MAHITNQEIPMPQGLESFLPKPEAQTEKPAVAQIIEPTVTTETKQPVSETTTPAVETPKVETPASETTPASKDEKPWWESPVSETTPAKAEEKAASEPDPVIYEKKAKLLDDLMNRPDFKYLAEGIIAGKPVEELVKDFQTVDYNKLDADAVFKHYGQLKGWTEDEVEEEIGAFNEMRKFQKEDTLEAMTAKLNEAQAGKLSKVAGGYREEMQKRAAEEAARDQFIEKRFTEEVQKEKQFLEGKDFFGVKFTKEDADDFEKFVTTFDFVREDGTYDVPALRTFWLGARKLSSIQKANYATGKSEGTVETLKEIHRPAESSAAVTRLPEIKKPLSAKEGALQAAKNMHSGNVQITTH